MGIGEEQIQDVKWIIQEDILTEKIEKQIK
jgi:hypothetical protein